MSDEQESDDVADTAAAETVEQEVVADTEEVAALKAERDELAAEVAALRQPREHRVRRVLAVVGVLLTCVLLFTTVVGVWAKRSFLKTDVFSARAGNLIDDPGVQAALGAYLAGEINSLIDPQAIFEEALPERATILAVPLAGAVEGFVTDKVDEFVASDTFNRLWKEAVTVAHREMVRVLEGDTPLVEESSDRIVINLLPVVNQVLARITQASPEIFGREVNLPDVTVQDVPASARQAIGDALGVDLDDDFGTFTVYDDGALQEAQAGFKLINRLVWVLGVFTILALVLTLLLSPRRRRTLLQLSVGFIVVMVLLRRIVFLFQEDLLNLVKVPRNVPAVQAASDTFLDPLTTGALVIAWLALAVAAVAWLSGPYPWAVKVRAGVVAGARTVVRVAGDRAQDEETIDWVAEHKDPLRVGGAVVAVLLLFWLDLSWLGFFLLAALIGAYEVVVTRLADRGEAPEDRVSPEAGDAATSAVG